VAEFEQSTLGPDATVLEVNYRPDTPDPARVFRAMARLIDAFHQTDRDLARAIHVSIEPVLLLQRVEAGSIRAILRTLLRQINDDSLENLDWKPLVGQYLVKAKHKALRWLDRRTSLQSRTEVMRLQTEIMSLAPLPKPGQLLLPEPVPPARLLEDIKAISEAMSELKEDDSAVYISAEEETAIERDFQLTTEVIEAILTEDIVASETEERLLVKKPDYLGTSRWEFRLDDHPLEAKILDEPWLERFHRGEVVLKPGDSLRALLRAEVLRGFEGNTVARRHFVLEVLGVDHGPSDDQEKLVLGSA